MRFRFYAFFVGLSLSVGLQASPAWAQVSRDLIASQAAIDVAEETIANLENEAKIALEAGQCYGYEAIRRDLRLQAALVGSNRGIPPLTRAELAAKARRVLAALPEDCPRGETQQASESGYSTSYYYIPGTDTALKISGYSGAVRHENNFIGNGTGIGTVIVPGDPRFAMHGDRATGVSGTIGVRFRGDSYRHGFDFTYGRTASNASAYEPMGGNQIGYVPNNSALGAGANLGNGFDTSATSDVTQNRVQMNYSLLRPFSLTDLNGETRSGDDYYDDDDDFESEKKQGLVVTFRYQDYEHEGSLWRTTNPNNVYANANQDLKSYSLLAGPAIMGRNTSRNGIYLSGSLSLQAGIISSKLNVREETCFFCGGMPTFDLLSDRKNDFAWDLGARVGIGYSFNNFNAGVSLGFTYGTKHVLHVRGSPNDASTRIKKDIGADLTTLFRLSRNF